MQKQDNRYEMSSLCRDNITDMRCQVYVVCSVPKTENYRSISFRNTEHTVDTFRKTEYNVDTLGQTC